MAGLPVGSVVSKRDICRTQQITPAFLIKIMQPLLAQGLVNSHRGVKGGFSLKKSPADISLWDIITAVEGPIYLNKCLIRSGFCARDKTCPVHQVWRNIKDNLEKTLSHTTLDKLAVMAIEK